MSKLTTNQRIQQDKPIEIWENVRAGWKWKVWKFYKAPGKSVKLQRWRTQVDEYGRAFCTVTSPMTGGCGDMGDVYYRDIIANARLTYLEEENETNS